MFNLLMRGGDWNDTKSTMALSRVFEYTDDHLKSSFSRDGKPAFDWMIQYPCIFMDEGTTDEPVYVGRISRARVTGSDVTIEYQIDREVPVFTNSFVYLNRSKFEMNYDFEFSRHHWAIKEADLYQILFQTMRAPVRHYPDVFKIPEQERINPRLVSAMMPFASNFNGVYRAITEAAAEVGMECARADNVWDNHAIIQDIVQLIDEARIVVVDCTTRNPNVFYEAGIAHTLGRDVIMITQHKDDIPFDLQHLRYIPYLNNGEGHVDLKSRLVARMKGLMSR